MQAAERIFEGQFDDVQDEYQDVQMDHIDRDDMINVKRTTRLAVSRQSYLNATALNIGSDAR
jgi:hypothetical protein